MTKDQVIAWLDRSKLDALAAESDAALARANPTIKQAKNQIALFETSNEQMPAEPKTLKLRVRHILKLSRHIGNKSNGVRVSYASRPQQHPKSLRQAARQDIMRHDDKISSPARRGALECMLWAGTGVLWTIAGGVPESKLIGSAFAKSETSQKGFSFIQISDSHIGFSKPANPDALGTLKETAGKLAALPEKPAFLIHTGDITHLSKPQEFDDAAQVIGGLKIDGHYVPGEHDYIDEGSGKAYLERYGKDTQGTGYYSFDQAGVHFVGLVNVADLKAGGLGNLGDSQLAWLKADLASRSASQPIVVFSHIPLWMVYPEWGWGTNDGAQALSLLARFGSVTVLNGHIHQLMQKVEGNITFHTALSTAFPQPAPGTAPSPGPKLVPPGQLRDLLGVSTVLYRQGTARLAITGHTLAEAS